MTYTSQLGTVLDARGATVCVVSLAWGEGARRDMARRIALLLSTCGNVPTDVIGKTSVLVLKGIEPTKENHYVSEIKPAS